MKCDSCVDVYGPRRIATVYFGWGRRVQLLSYIRLRDAAGCGWPRASMVVRSPCPQRPRGMNKSSAGPHIRFTRRRCNRFSIQCRSLQLLVGNLYSSIEVMSRSRHGDAECTIIGNTTPQQDPGDARVFIGQRDSCDIGMSSLTQLL